VAPANQEELAARLRDNPSRAGVFCDFDGTLAEIVERPEDSRPVDGAVDALAALVEPYARVAVISGRPARFLLTHLGGRGLHLAGLYGLEVVRDGEVQVVEDAKGWEPTVEEVVARLSEEAPEGLHVEPKGLSVTLHFRTAPELEEEARRMAEEVAESCGLVVGEGRRSFELRPPVATSKGTVVAEAAADLDAACFLGDDHGDLTAFDALDDLEARGAAVVRVAVRSGESPEELVRRADAVLDGPADVIAFLRALRP
jgi:trehalose 6-phosphate phosphatase